MKKKIILGCSAIALALSTAFLFECPPPDLFSRTVLLPCPEDCGKFYSCSYGVPILMHCPDGLYFNAEWEVCDWPQNVPCEDGGGNGGGGIVMGWGYTRDDCGKLFEGGKPGETFEIEVNGERIELKYNAVGSVFFVMEDIVQGCVPGGNMSSCKEEECPTFTIIN